MAAVHHRPRYPAAALCAGALVAGPYHTHCRTTCGLQAEQLGFTSSRIPDGFIGTGRHMVHHRCCCCRRRRPVVV
ncbi:unnamed protein product [Gadus morhua 'NCC']